MDQFLGYFGYGSSANTTDTDSSTMGKNVSKISMPSRQSVVEHRGKHIGDAQTMFYKTDPLLISHGDGQYLYDEAGVKYLDCISNVQHVGHAHPAVAHAVAEQMLKSNCNSRFLNPKLAEVANRIAATLPGDIRKCYMTNSGSEANDVALRMARDYTGGTEVIVLEHAYHGHIASIMDISPYKFDKLKTQPSWVHVAPLPDVYRGKHRLSERDLHDDDAARAIAEVYANEVAQICEKITKDGKKVCAFYMEAMTSCGGQVIPPKGYLDKVIDIIHAAGGLVVVDEVQTGFGRAGCSFWAYQSYSPDAIPDIVTMGKPMGNGFPVSAAFTRAEIADGLGQGKVEYFNTFGGNPVACSAVLAVLDIIEKEKLQEHAAVVGEHFLSALRNLQAKHACIGDVRGQGLFLGVDLVTDRETREPHTGLASECQLYMRKHYNILLNSEGPHANIVKIKPPMPFTKENVDEVVAKLDETLAVLVK